MENKSDANTHIQELKDIIQKFCNEREWGKFHNPKELAIGMSTESGELLQLFRFKSEEQMVAALENQEKRNQISEELADVFYYILLFSSYTNIDLTKSLKRKMELNLKHYPVEKSIGNNTKYNEINN